MALLLWWKDTQFNPNFRDDSQNNVRSFKSNLRQFKSSSTLSIISAYTPSQNVYIYYKTGIVLGLQYLIFKG